MTITTAEAAAERRCFFQEASGPMGESFQASLPMQSSLMATLSSSGRTLREADFRTVLFASPLTPRKTALAGASTHWLAPLSLDQVSTAFDRLDCFQFMQLVAGSEWHSLHFFLF